MALLYALARRAEVDPGPHHIHCHLGKVVPRVIVSAERRRALVDSERDRSQAPARSVVIEEPRDLPPRVGPWARRQEWDTAVEEDRVCTAINPCFVVESRVQSLVPRICRGDELAVPDACRRVHSTR